MLENMVIYIFTLLVKLIILVIGFALIVKEIYKYKIEPMLK